MRSLQEHVDALPWHHELDLGNGVRTPGAGLNPSCVVAMLRDVGFEEIEFAPDPAHPTTRGIFHGHRR